MSNELKFGNKVVFLGGNPLTLPISSTDPGSPITGDVYYNSTSNTVRYYNGTAWGAISAGGTVTSVALADGGGSIFSVSGSPITTSGTISLNLANQSANTILAGPTTGSAAAPTFRSLVAADIPALSYANQTLSNLGTTSINASLIPDVDATKDLGTSSKKWSTLYVSTVSYPSGPSIDMSTGSLIDSAATTKLSWDTTGVKFNALTASTVPYLDSSKYLVSSSVTPTELGYLSGVTSGIQTQLSSKLSTALTSAHILVGNASNIATDVAVSGEASISNIGSVTLSNAAVIAKTLTGFTSGAGSLSSSDSILSAIQKLDGNDGLRVLKSGDAMTDNLTFSNSKGIDSTTPGDTLNVGASSGTINLGGVSSTVNILGTLTYVNSTNLQVTDKTITINKGGAASSAASAGIEVEENSVITGWVEINSDESKWELKAPAASGKMQIAPSSAAFTGILAAPVQTATRTWTFPDASGNVALISSGTNAANDTLSNLGTTSINANLLPDGNNTRNLGSGALTWANTYSRSVISDAGLTLSASSGSSDVSITAAGNLVLNAQKQRWTTDGTNFTEEQYFDALTLTANTSSPTEISSSLSFSVSAFDSAEVEYRIKEATSGKVRVGKFIVTSDATITSSSDQYSETAALGSALGLSLGATLTGGNVVITYNNTHATNAATMRCRIKRFRA